MNHLFRKLRSGWQMKSLRRELSGLSDGQLNDLGQGAGPRPDAN